MCCWLSLLLSSPFPGFRIAQASQAHQVPGWACYFLAPLLPISVSDTTPLDYPRQARRHPRSSGSHIPSTPSVTPVLLSNGSEIHVLCTHCDHSCPDGPDDSKRLLVNLSASSFAPLQAICHDASTVIFLICKSDDIIGLKPIRGLLLSLG